MTSVACSKRMVEWRGAYKV